MSLPSNVANLSQALHELSQDPRLKEVTGSDEDSICGLYLWLLEMKQSKSHREYRLLFGWVIPRITGVLNRWTSFNSLPSWKTVPYEFRIHRLVFHHSGNRIINLVKLLCQGLTLGDACQQMSIAQPNQPQNQFCLETSSQKIVESFVVRPVVFLESALSTLQMIDGLKPPKSPIEGVSAFMGTLYRCNKLNLFYQLNGKPFPEVDDLARICLNHLQDETGLDFRNADSSRLGNLEWLCFPVTNHLEQPQISIVTDCAPNQAEVRILPKALPAESSALIRCRAKNGGAIILDQCKIVQVSSHAEISATFEAKEQIGSVTVTVWIREPHSDSWHIWYEHSSPTRWQLDLNLGQAGPQVDLPSDWLQEFANSRIQTQIEKSQSFNQVNYEWVQIGGNDVEPWILSTQKMRDFAQTLFPPQSSGEFFQTGWAGDEPGRFSFFKWLQHLTNDPTASKVLIVDPYFDTPGILELIARVSAVQAEYVVLTTTQIKSDDDALEANMNAPQLIVQSLEPQRANRLKTACYQLQILLKNLKFRLLDVRSTEGGKNQIFHDRYILVFNQKGDAKAGYHLSNSIQGATKFYPLLITPIPRDVLPSVENYVATELLQPINSKRQVYTIFSSTPELTTPPTNQALMGLEAIPHSNLFFATLLQNVTLMFLSQDDLGEQLQTYGFYNTTEREFALRESNLERVESILSQFVQTLLLTDTGSFTKLWAGLGGWLDRTSEHEEYLTQIISLGGVALATQLHIFLSQALDDLKLPMHTYDPTAQADALQISNFLKQSFIDALYDAERLLILTDSRAWQVCLEDNGIRYATQALAILDSAKLIDVLEEFRQALVQEPLSLDFYRFWCLIYAVSFTTQQLLWQLIIGHFHNKPNVPLIENLLKSNLPSIRAVAAYSLSPLTPIQSEEELNLGGTFSLLTHLTEVEKIQVLVEWVFRLRIIANRTHGETETVQRLRLIIFEEMRQIFPSNLTSEEVLIITNRLSGPCQGDWARTTTEELFQSLVDDGKLSLDCITDVWFSILFNYLNKSLPTSSKQSGTSTSVSDSRLDFSSGLELIDVCAKLVVNATSDCCSKWLAEILELNQAVRRLLYQPFLRSRNYQVWHNASNCALWLQSLIHLSIRTYRLTEKLNDAAAEELQQVSGQLDEILTRTYEENSLENKKLLWEFTANLKGSV